MFSRLERFPENDHDTVFLVDLQVACHPPAAIVMGDKSIRKIRSRRLLDQALRGLIGSYSNVI